MESNQTLDQHYKQLYLKLCQGDQQASKELVNLFTPRIFNYIRRAFSSEYVNDYVQLAWLKLVESCSHVLKHENIGAFMMSIAKNAVIDEIRKSKAKSRVQNEKYKTEVTDIDHNEALNPEYLLALIDKEKQHETKKQFFNQALAELSLVQRQALYLKLQKHSLAEIAVITNTKKETVKTRLRSAKNALKKIIADKKLHNNELLEV